MLIKKDPDTTRSYLEDSSNLKGGHADRVVLPETIEEAAAVLRDAYSNNICVTVSGGGTGTSGARIPFGGTALSTERLNKILDISEAGMSCIIQAGVLVEDLKAACEKKGFFYTSHPTEKTAFVGGTVATNASGARSFKYGPTRRYVKRLKMVLPCGEIFEIRRGERKLTKVDHRIELGDGLAIDVPLPTYRMPMVKNSAGYFAKDGMDLVDLFIGQEGTLSVITEMEIGLVKKPASILSCFVFFKHARDAWNFSDEARKLSGKKRHAGDEGVDALSLEYFDSNSLGILRSKNTNLPREANAAIFFEQETTSSHIDALAERWLDIIKKHNASIDDTWVAINQKDAEAFAEFRHAVPDIINDMVRRGGFPKLSTDIAVPSRVFASMMDHYIDLLGGSGIEYFLFGHIGECHLHTNLLPGSESQLEKAKDVCLSLIKKGVALGGTISAEHGVGKTKHAYLEIMYGPDGILEMARIKKAFDPHCILGRGNIFPEEVLDLV